MLFESEHFSMRELEPEELPTLQALFDSNPDYFLTVGGKPPRPDEAKAEFEELPPEHLSYTKRWFAGIFGRTGVLEGLIIVVSDLSASGVWHIALFFLASSQHGTGAGQEIYYALEKWMASHKPSWLRLGVVDGNERAKRFWARLGFMKVRERVITNASGEPKTTSVLVKPLAGGTTEGYVSLVPRDDPNSTLP